jgi:hypothetical protein
VKIESLFQKLELLHLELDSRRKEFEEELKATIE